MSADGNYIAIGTGDYNNYTGYVRLFSRGDNAPLWSYKTSSSDLSTYGVYSVVISADGNYIAASEQFYAGGFSRHGLYLLSRSSGTPIWSSVPSYWTSPGTRVVAGISSDGSRILVKNTSRDAVELYKRESSTAPSEGEENQSGQSGPGPVPSESSNWWLLLLYFLISAVLAAWVYRDSRGRRMNRGAWAGLTFLASFVGLTAYLKKRKLRRER
jgi:hypothetical protein